MPCRPSSDSLPGTICWPKALLYVHDGVYVPALVQGLVTCLLVGLLWGKKQYAERA